VHVVVRRKWDGGASREGALPESLATTIPWAENKVTIRVPVDVSQEPATVLHAWDCDASGDNHTISGTATCLVSFGSSPGRYIVGCHHVLALSEIDPLPPAQPVMLAYQGAAVGHEAALPVDPTTMDAALALVSGVNQISFNAGGKTVRITKVLAAGSPAPASYYVLTRHGVRSAHLSAAGVTKDQSGYFGNGTTLSFSNVIVSLGDTDLDVFQAGDSGAPLVTGDGTLIGMHFSGLADNVSTTSYAFTAADVFGAFALPLALI
jgi:hypothetical protein